MKALDSSLKEELKVYEAINEEKKALYSDFAHHLIGAFPGVRLQFYESVTPAEA